MPSRSDWRSKKPLKKLPPGSRDSLANPRSAGSTAGRDYGRILVVNRAGWHTAQRLTVPGNLRLLPQPARSEAPFSRNCFFTREVQLLGFDQDIFHLMNSPTHRRFCDLPRDRNVKIRTILPPVLQCYQQLILQRELRWPSALLFAPFVLGEYCYHLFEGGRCTPVNRLNSSGSKSLIWS